MHWKSARNRPKIGCACRHFPRANRHKCRLAPSSAKARLPYFVFSDILGVRFDFIFTKRKNCLIKFSKFCMDCQTRAFRHALSISFQKKKKINQKITYKTIFKKGGGREN